MTVGRSLYQHYYRHFSLPVVYLFHLAPPDVFGIFLIAVYYVRNRVALCRLFWDL